MSELNDWQQRVVDEATELGKKIIALNKFFYDPGSIDLDDDVKFDLRAQNTAMTQYHDVLVRRIKGFGARDGE